VFKSGIVKICFISWRRSNYDKEQRHRRTEW